MAHEVVECGPRLRGYDRIVHLQHRMRVSGKNCTRGTGKLLYVTIYLDFMHIYIHIHTHTWGFPGGSVVKNLPANAGDLGKTGSIPASGRSPRGENGNPLQHSCLENPMDRGAWWPRVHGISKSLM